MLNFSNRSTDKELLDGKSIPCEDIILNMKELNTINSLLGGHKITLAGLRRLVGGMKEISILEIGCGGGDNIRVIEKYCNAKGIRCQLLGIDINNDIAKFASSQNSKLKLFCEDYRNVFLDSKPDIIFSSLFCHHFTDNELVEQVQWMKSNSKVGFFINDLQRHWLAYYSIKILTRLFSKSYLVKNDAPLSVARSFRREEWLLILERAEIFQFSIHWKWAFRYLIVFKNE